MVDTAAGKGVRVEPVDGAGGGIPVGRRFVRIGQHVRPGESRIDLIGLVDIEIAAHKDRLIRPAHLLNLPHDQLGAFRPGNDTDMVHVQGKVPNFLPGHLVLKVGPGADPVQRGIPAPARFLRRLGQPEPSFVQQVETVTPPEDRRPFPLFQSVVAADIDIIIVRKTVAHVMEHVDQNFLGTEDIRLFIPDQLTDIRIPGIPGIAAFGIAPVFIAHIERRNRPGGFARAGDGRRQAKQDQKLFHSAENR